MAICGFEGLCRLESEEAGLSRTYHSNLDECLIAIVQQISRLSSIDAHHTKHKLSTESQSHRLVPPVYNCSYTALDVRLEDLRL